MSIFNTSELIAGGAGSVTANLAAPNLPTAGVATAAVATPAVAGQSSLVLSPQALSYQAPLTYAIFYTGGATFNGTFGKFVKS